MVRLGKKEPTLGKQSKVLHGKGQWQQLAAIGPKSGSQQQHRSNKDRCQKDPLD